MAQRRVLQFTLQVVGGRARLDSEVHARIGGQTGLSRREIKRRIEAGALTLGGERILRADRLLAEGEHEVAFELEMALGGQAKPEPGGNRVPVVYEDSAVLVLDKPSGMPSLPHSGDELGTAVNHALAHEPGLARVNPGLEPGLLHRLDTGTSGLLAFAKTPAEYERLREAWRSRAVRKTYRAVVSLAEPDAIAPLPRLIDVPLARDAKSSRRMVACPAGSRRAIRGRELPARTWIREARALGGGRADLTVEIETGVMHQIRCHLAHVGLPIRGDTLYAKEAGPGRLWLHAWRLELPREAGAALTLEAALPAGWPGG